MKVIRKDTTVPALRGHRLFSAVEELFDHLGIVNRGDDSQYPSASRIGLDIDATDRFRASG